jgi:hypothetical protein
MVPLFGFVAELFERAGQEWLASMGTTGLAVAIGYAQPTWKLISIWFHSGTQAMTQHLKETAKNGAVLTVGVWMLLFVYDILWKVPQEISNDPAQISEPLYDWRKFSDKFPHPPSNAFLRLAPRPVTATARGKSEVRPKLPKVKEWAVAFGVPFLIGGDIQGIPSNNYSESSPLHQTYLILASLDRSEIEQQFDSSTWKRSLVPEAVAIRFASEAMRYCILRSIAEMQEPTTFFSYETGKGGTSTTAAAVPVPNAKLYPPQKLDDILTKTKFARPGTTNWDGPYIERRIFWERKHFAVPEGTMIEVTPDGLLFADPQLYKLRFTVQFTLKNVGVLPPHFALTPLMRISSSDLLELMFNVNIHFEWHGEYDEAEPYVDWATGLGMGLEQRFKQELPQ